MASDKNNKMADEEANQRAWLSAQNMSCNQLLKAYPAGEQTSGWAFLPKEELGNSPRGPNPSLLKVPFEWL